MQIYKYGNDAGYVILYDYWGKDKLFECKIVYGKKEEDDITSIRKQNNLYEYRFETRKVMK